MHRKIYSIKRTYVLVKEYIGSPKIGTERICTRPTPNNYDLMEDNWLVINEDLVYPHDLTTESYVWNSDTNEPNSVCCIEGIEFLQTCKDLLPYYRFSSYKEVEIHLKTKGKVLNVREVHNY